MAKPITKEEVLFRQRLLKASGFDPGPLDGLWGSRTGQADAAFEAESETLRAQLGGFDPRSETAIMSLHIKAQAVARRFMAKARGFKVGVKILSGTRTYAEQNALYAKGRGFTPGPKVTNAKGGESNHNFGIAWDGGAYLTGANQRENALYAELATATQAPDLEWGGSWTSFKDLPHYQVKTGKPLSQVRGLFEQGAPYV